jgi:hypothetical protein
MITFLTCARTLQERVDQPDMAGMVEDGFNAAVWLADPDNIAVTDGRNILMFEQVGDRVYKGHWLMVDRVPKAFLTAIDLLRYMFVACQARAIVGMVPAFNRASRWFTRQMGFKSLGLTDTAEGQQEHFSMTRQKFEARYGFFEVQEEADQPSVSVYH